MAVTYSTYDAKARFSEILRKVRSGQHVTISHRGLVIAEIRPIYGEVGVEAALQALEDRGVVGRAAAPIGPLALLAKKPGALTRFLKSRE